MSYDWIFAGMKDSRLKEVKLSEDATEISFLFEDEKLIRFTVTGDCCSESWIEHLEVPVYCMGQKIEEITQQAMEIHSPDHTCLQVYKTEFRTPKGSIVLEYRNSSNGYYGGYLVRLA